MGTVKKRFLEIEEIRRKIFEQSKKILSLDIYLERAQGVTPKERRKAENDIAELKKLRQKTLKILSNLVSNTKENYNELFKDWVQIHIKTCIDIIEYAKNAKASVFDKDSTKIFVANQTKQKWENVLLGKELYVIPNVYYLEDYDKFFDKIAEKYFNNEIKHKNL